MARLLGIKGEKRYMIAVAGLTGGTAPMLPALHALQLVSSALGEHVERAGLGPVRPGRIISSQAQAEAGLYLDRGFTEGASVGMRCKPLAEHVELTVSRSSPALRAVVWASLAIGLLAGLIVAPVLMPASSDKLILIVGLSLGLVIALIAMIVAARVDALAGGRSAAMAEALDAAVRGWLTQSGREAEAKESTAPL
jgi:hypothetical protein